MKEKESVHIPNKFRKGEKFIARIERENIKLCPLAEGFEIPEIIQWNSNTILLRSFSFHDRPVAAVTTLIMLCISYWDKRVWRLTRSSYVPK
jgi:hypothetical protein